LIEKIIEQAFLFADKSEARKYFFELRQKFVSWNSAPFKENNFQQLEQNIQQQLEAGKKGKD